MATRGSETGIEAERTAREDVPEDQPRRRILIVEEDSHVRERLRMVLEQNRHRVLEAADGVAGVMSALVDQPEIAFVGVDLPQLDGYEVARRIRANQDTQYIYLVALTGRARDRVRACEAGFDEYVITPIDPDHLAGILAARPVRSEA
jgi:two-component system, sensor histidine kinase